MAIDRFDHATLEVLLDTYTDGTLPEHAVVVELVGALRARDAEISRLTRSRRTESEQRDAILREHERSIENLERKLAHAQNARQQAIDVADDLERENETLRKELEQITCPGCGDNMLEFSVVSLECEWCKADALDELGKWQRAEIPGAGEYMELKLERDRLVDTCRALKEQLAERHALTELFTKFQGDSDTLRAKMMELYDKAIGDVPLPPEARAISSRVDRLERRVEQHTEQLDRALELAELWKERYHQLREQWREDVTHLNKLRYMPGRTRTWEEECESQARVIEAWEAAAQENAPEPPTFEQAMQVASRKIAGLTEEVEQLRAELGGQCECCGRPTAGRFCGGCAEVGVPDAVRDRETQDNAADEETEK